ncbi:MAG: carbohydrate kinase family protein [Anaerolineales bacterium]|nr:carbohydrate kinase family protein [Anaerolineales bacterium]
MNIVLTGSVAFDYLMTFPGYFRDHILPDKIETISLSFLVDNMVKLRGGIAPNIAYTLALLGERPRLLAAVGEDFEEYRAWLESKGVDTSGARLIPGVFTASCFTSTDRANAQITSFFPGAMAYAAQLSLRDLRCDDSVLVVISPNDPQAMQKYIRECHEMNLSFIYDPSQQIVRMTPEELKAGINGALALFVNDYEFGLIQKMTGMSQQDILQQVQFMVVTCGERGATIYADEQEFNIPVVPPQQIVDPTGVGDAFRGGFLVAFSHQLDWETCGRVGALAATYCLENAGPQGHSYTPSQFVQRFRGFFDDQGKLDVFMK